MPIDLRFKGRSIDTMVTVWNDSLDQSWQFTLGGVPDSVTLDPDSWILKTVQYGQRTLVDDGSIPADLELSANYPNPFNGTTRVRFGLPERGHVLIEVFDLAGRRVATLANEVMQEGRAEVPWNAVGSTGTYVCRLVFTTFRGSSVVARRMLYLK
jgi:hypothetical protein